MHVRAGSDTQLAMPEQLAQVQQYLGNLETGQAPSSEQTAAWQHFYEYQSQTIERFARGWQLVDEDVHDCVQEVWRELLVRLPRFHLDVGRSQFSTWLYTIVRSKAMDLHRGRNNKVVETDTNWWEQLTDPASDTSTLCANRELLQLALDELRDHLPTCTYQVLQLRLVEQQPVCQVAAALQISHAQVWYRYHRAKKLLEQIARALAEGLHHPPHCPTTGEGNMKNNSKTAPRISAAPVSQNGAQRSSQSQGGSSVDLVFKRLELGRQSLNPEWKVEWECGGVPTPVLFIRKLSMVAYAEICGPEEIINDHWPQIAHAAVHAGVNAGIATIIATPTAALSVFSNEFAKQLDRDWRKAEHDDIRVALSARQEPNGPWSKCETST